MAPRALFSCFVPLVLTACQATAPAVSLERANLDPSCDPCQDIYQFTNGGWIERNPLPADRSSWSTFSELRERNFVVLKDILDEAVEASAPMGTPGQKIGDFYCSCMDEQRAEREGAEPLVPFLEAIDKMQSVGDLQQGVTQLHARGFGTLFRFFVDQDAEDATQVLPVAWQGGLGLPDRDDYFRADERSVTVREEYLQHITRTFQLLGESEAQAVAHAAAVMDIETRLAQASMTRVEMRDPHAVYNKMTVGQAAEATPGFSWLAYLRTIGLSSLDQLNVAQPEFFATMGQLLSEIPLQDWKAYLRWHVTSDLAPTLSQAFVDEDFRFQGQVLRGQQEQQPRWKRCLELTDDLLGEALGQVYVERAFSPEAKRRALEMVENLRAEFRERIQQLDWMGAETKAKALAKLEAFRPKIGYPDRWRDYSELAVDRGTFAANLIRAQAFDFRRQVSKVGKPVDRDEWFMSPPTVNAYYNPGLNEIVFPAGILQPPFFGEQQDDALNYGAMGAVIGHEMTHGFDDQGSQYDAQGNLKNWWTDEDRAEFMRRADIVRQQFDEYTVLGDVPVNGSLTLGENIADLGGITIAYHAWLRSLEGKPHPADKDGFTAEQRVFLAWAQCWRNTTSDEALRLRVQTNSHAPGRYRAIGPLSNMPEFQQAFRCASNAPMMRAPGDQVRIW